MEKYLHRLFASSINLKQKPTQIHNLFVQGWIKKYISWTFGLERHFIAKQKPEIKLKRHTHNKPPHPRTVLGRLKTWLTPGYDEISFSPPRSLRRKLQIFYGYINKTKARPTVGLEARSFDYGSWSESADYWVLIYCKIISTLLFRHFRCLISA